MRATFLGLICLLASGACARETRPPPVPATVRSIREPSELLWGPSAFGELGDLRLENGKIMAVIARVDRPLGFAVSGGNVVDLAPLPDGEDHINQIILYLNDEFPRQARYEKLRIVSKGGGSKPVIVRAEGKDSGDPRIEIETDYILEPEAEWLRLETRFTSTATSVIAGYIPGDAIQWGRAEHMAPGFGFDLPGTRVKVDWLAGLGQSASYALVPDGDYQFETLSGSTWSDPMAPPVDLQPKKTFEYVRHLVVGTGDTASLADKVYRIRNQAVGKITGRVTHGADPVPDAKVAVSTPEGALVGIAMVAADGWYSLTLPLGAYRAVAFAPGRERIGPIGSPGEFSIGERENLSLSFNMGPEATIKWRIRGHDGKAPPVKLTVIGAEGTKDPMFGPVFRASGARNTILSARGVGHAPVGSGTYRVLVSRGPEYEVIESKVTVGPGETAEVTGSLVRSVDTAGFIAADLHQHAAPSFDSGVSLEDRVLSNGTEGVEVLVSTDHNVLTDYRPALAASGLGRDIISIIGTEATTHSVGHFNAFPLRMDLSKPRGGMQDPEGWSPSEIFAFVRGLGGPNIAPFVQTNHPRAGRIGYFDLVGFKAETGTAKDPRFSPDIDGAEVISFGFREESEQVLADWFSLLRQGHKITATGNSDSHTIYGREVGWPRTIVCVDDDNPPRLDVAQFVRSLHEGCATVSGGPFATIHSGEVKMGGTLSAPNGRFSIDAKVQAPSWVSTSTLTVFVDGTPVRTIPLSSRATVRFDDRIELRCTKDCFATILVEGAEPMVDVLTTWRGRKLLPIALTNPIFVDVDGDGAYRAPTPSPD